MDRDTRGPVAVSRRIGAPASVIFTALATPSRHLEFDGSGMLRATDYEGAVGGVGDVFDMRMFNDEFGDYVMRNEVVEFEPDRRIAWAPQRHDVDDDDDWRHRWRYELEPDGPDATVVTETYEPLPVTRRGPADHEGRHGLAGRDAGVAREARGSDHELGHVAAHTMGPVACRRSRTVAPGSAARMQGRRSLQS